MNFPPEISDFSLYRELRYVESKSNKKIGDGTYGTVWLQKTRDPLSSRGTKDIVFKVSKTGLGSKVRISKAYFLVSFLDFSFRRREMKRIF